MIEIKDLYKRFGSCEVLKGINMTIERGEVVCIIGASGSGKSTLLRCINFLEKKTSGEIYIDGEAISKKKNNINAMRKKVGMVFSTF